MADIALTPDEQVYTLILHSYFKGVNRPDLCEVILGVKVKTTQLGPAVALLMAEGGYPEEDAPVVREAMKALNLALASDEGRSSGPVIRGPRFQA